LPRNTMHAGEGLNMKNDRNTFCASFWGII